MWIVEEKPAAGGLALRRDGREPNMIPELWVVPGAGEQESEAGKWCAVIHLASNWTSCEF